MVNDGSKATMIDKLTASISLWLVFCSNSLGRNVSFPSGFLLGTASSAYQIEGAWNEDGKGVNIWDHLVHTNRTYAADNTTGDVACDSYHKYRDDIALLKTLGVDFYRFSLSWTRILPDGLEHRINPQGLTYYNNLINALLAAGITPMATLYHWDLPHYLQKLGGFANPLIIKAFTNYARIAFESFGDRVKHWFTINEPRMVCLFGYENQVYAPRVVSPGVGHYLCAYNLLKAHAAVYHLYDEQFRGAQNGNISIVLESFAFRPATPGDSDAHDRLMQFNLGVYAQPIFGPDGDFPALVVERVRYRSEGEGFPRTRLPRFTPREVEYVKGTSDFFGLNHYTTWIVEDAEEEAFAEPSFFKDRRVKEFADEGLPGSAVEWLKVSPSGFRQLLNFINDNYNRPQILITENGFAEETQKLDDVRRISYTEEYLGAILDAIHEDNVTVIGYAQWSFLDSFEWSEGYTIGFGMYAVDPDDPEKKRTEKASARYYKKLLVNRKLTGYE